MSAVSWSDAVDDSELIMDTMETTSPRVSYSDAASSIADDDLLFARH